MKSRKWIGTVLLTLVVVTVLSAGGYALYRYGYTRGALAASSSPGFMFHQFEDMPFAGGHMGDAPGGYFRGMPQGRFDDMPHQFKGRIDGFGHPGMGFGQQAIPFSGYPANRSYFSPFTILMKVLFFGVFLWLVYKFAKLFTGGSNWKLSFTSTDNVEPQVEEKPRTRASKK